jgi:hypothetical protein
MSLLDFNIFSKLSHFASGWTRLSKKSLTEGISIDGSDISIDFEQDSDEDVVRLKDAKELKSSKKEGIPVYVGYMTKPTRDKNEKLIRKRFLEEVKKWGKVSNENLKELIDRTYPQKLREMKNSVKVIFLAGSSEPLAANIALALKEMYYPEAKIVDVLKKYYGPDVRSIVDWEEYEKADPKTKQMIDTYLRKASYEGSLTNMPDWIFDGYIKKSAGLQSGARRLLKSSHTIDQVIISSIREAESTWHENVYSNPNINPSMKLKLLPKYLVVDDTIIEGSTMKGIFRELMSPEIQKEVGQQVGSIESKLYGYALFTARAIN